MTSPEAALPALRAEIVPVTPFQQNCSVIVCTATGRAAAVDPGGDLDRIEAALARLGGTLEKVLLTHGHIDHCGAAGELAARCSVPIEGPHPADRFWIEQLPAQARAFGFAAAATAFEPARWLADGDTVRVGAQTLQVSHCPGHTPGHVVFFHAASRLALVGDVLFRGSVGRTDFPGSDPDALIDSIRTKLWPMGDEVTFIPGHGPVSTLGHERRTNPFVADRR